MHKVADEVPIILDLSISSIEMGRFGLNGRDFSGLTMAPQWQGVTVKGKKARYFGLVGAKQFGCRKNFAPTRTQSLCVGKSAWHPRVHIERRCFV